MDSRLPCRQPPPSSLILHCAQARYKDGNGTSERTCNSGRIWGHHYFLGSLPCPHQGLQHTDGESSDDHLHECLCQSRPSCWCPLRLRSEVGLALGRFCHHFGLYQPVEGPHRPCAASYFVGRRCMPVGDLSSALCCYYFWCHLITLLRRPALLVPPDLRSLL